MSHATESFVLTEPAAERGEAARAVSRERRAAAALSQFRAALVGSEPRDVLMLRAARVAAEILEVDLAAAAEMRDSDGKVSVRWIRGDGDEERTPDDQVLAPEGRASAWAVALETGRTLMIADLDRETRFHDAALQKAGIVSGLVCPLLEDTAAVGALGWFSRTSRRFTDAELEILDALMRLLADGMNPEPEMEISVKLSPTGAVEEIDAACRSVTGFELDEVQEKPLWETLLPASKAEEIRSALGDLRQGQAAAHVEGPLFTRDGGECRAAWTFTIVQQPDGRVQSVVGTGVVTPECPLIQPAPVSAKALEMQSLLTEAEIFVRRGRLPPPALLEKMLKLQQDDERPALADPVREGFRRPYPYVQRLAAWGGGRLPRRRDFFEVQCCDIAATGFSFYIDRRPRFKRIVVAVGPEESPVYLVADVRHVTAGKGEHRGSYLVGCEFRGRVYY